MKKNLVLVLLALAALVLVSACSAPTQAPTAAPATAAPSGGGGAQAGNLKLVKVCVSWNEKIHSLVQAWQDYMQKYGNTYGPQNGVIFQWVVNVANGDTTQQANNIQDCINQKVDIIVARAEDSGAIGASITAAKNANIPFVTFDRASSSVKPTTHVGEDSYAQAISTSEAFAKLLKDNNVQGKCIELEGDLLDQNAVKRHQAWTDTEKKLGQWTTITSVPTEWKPEKFYSGALAALQAHPEANCMYVASDFTFTSVENALQAVNKLAPTGDPNHMWMAAEDVNPQGLQAMLKKEIDVGTTWDAWSTATQLVEVLTKIAKGEQVQPEYLVKGRLATPATVESLDNLYARDYRD